MGRKAALGRDAQALERLLARLAAALGDHVGGLVDAPLHLLLVLELRELGRHDAQHHVLVGRQLCQRREAARPRRVVFEVVRRRVERAKQFGRDAVVGAFGEVARADKVACVGGKVSEGWDEGQCYGGESGALKEGKREVATRRRIIANLRTSAQVDADVHVLGDFGNAIVVKLDVGIESVVGIVLVAAVILPTIKHLLGAKVRQVGVVVLDIADSGLVQNVQLRLIRFGNVGKVLLVAAVHVGGVRLSLPVAQMVPVGCGERELDLAPALLGHERLEVFDLVDVARLARVLDLADANDRLAGHVVRLEEGRHVGHVGAEHVERRLLDLFHAFKRRPKRSPEHVAPVSTLEPNRGLYLVLDQ